MDYNKSLKNLQETYVNMVNGDSTVEYEEMITIPNDITEGSYELADDDGNVIGEIEIVETYINESNDERVALVVIKENILKKGVGKYASAQQAASDRIDRAAGVTKKTKPGLKRGLKRMGAAAAIGAKDLVTLGMNKGRKRQRADAKKDYAKRDTSTFRGAAKGLGGNLKRRMTSG